VNQRHQSLHGSESIQTPDWGPKWLVEERDACGVGFLADQHNRPSHDLVTRALAALDCMEHRGGCCADQDSGDGAGVMTAIPWAVLNRWVTRAQGHSPPSP
jgi:glutamate synthase (ferredoxin)